MPYYNKAPKRDHNFDKHPHEFCVGIVARNQRLLGHADLKQNPQNFNPVSAHVVSAGLDKVTLQYSSKEEQRLGFGFGVILGFYCDYIGDSFGIILGIMWGIYWGHMGGYIGIMEKKMETTINYSSFHSPFPLSLSNPTINVYPIIPT